MNITIGNVVRGSNFFDRELLLEKLWGILETDSVLLAAPRRVGKTSIMHRIIDHPAGDFVVLFLDGQSYTTADDLVTDLIIKAGELTGDTKGFIGKTFSKVQKNLEEIAIWKLRIQLRKEVAGRWREEGERAVRGILEHPGRLVLVLDELPIMLHKMVQRDTDQGKQDAVDLLDWLRYLRTQPEMNLRVRQIAGGSIGLPRIASYLGASHKINDLRQVEVGPFDRDTARELATILLESRDVELDFATMEFFLDQVGTFLPIYIQIMAAAVADEVREKKIKATPKVVTRCYEERALGPEYKICFEDYFERLHRYYRPDETRTAQRILRELALSDEAVARSTLLALFHKEMGPECNATEFDLLLNWLRDDFYIEDVQEGRQILFKNKWLKDWWRRYHVSGK